MRPVVATGTLIGAVALAAVAYLIGAGSSGSSEPPGVREQVDAAVPQLEDYVREAMSEWEVPAVAIGIVADDELVYARGFGSGEQGREVDPDTMFEIGSATKSFLGASLAMLVDRGLLSWQDRVIDHYPDFALADPWVTREFRIGDLLAQRSGLAPYAADVLSLLGYDPTDSIAAIGLLKAESGFRSEFAYQNVPHQIASRIVAEKTGNPDWNEAARELLLEPLGMKSSGTSADRLTGSSNSTRGHQVRNGELRKVEPVSLPERVYGAGSIVSNVKDMSRWIRFQLGRGELDGEQLLARHQHAATWRPQISVTGDFARRMEQVPGATDLAYATGWFVHSIPEGRVIEHGGTTLGYTSAVRLDPDRGIGIVVLTNQAHDGGIANPISKFALDLLQGREPHDPLGGENDQDPPPPPRRRDEAERQDIAEQLVGTYRHPVAGRMRITARDGRLRTRLGPKRIPARLETVGPPFELTWRVDGRRDGPEMSAPVTPRRENGRVIALAVADVVFKRVE